MLESDNRSAGLFVICKRGRAVSGQFLAMPKGVPLEHQTPWNLENLKGAISLGGQTVKSLELVNGGAAIGILSFYGNIALSCYPVADPHMVAEGLKAFGGGVALATFCGIFGYVSQVRAAVGPIGYAEIVLRGLAVAVGTLSAVAFVTGLFDVGLSFEHPEWARKPAWCQTRSAPLSDSHSQ